MRLIAVILILLTIVFAALFIGGRFFPQNKIISSLISPIHNLINPIDVKERFTNIRNRYRLKPDGRMLVAVGEIHNFLTSEPKTPPEIIMTDNGWNIVYGKDKSLVGSLPDLPDFADYHALLKQWAHRIITTKNLIFSNPSDSSGIIYSYNISKLIRTLQESGYQWQSGNHNPALLEQALINYVTLAMIAIDTAEIYDVLSSRPMAFLVITQLAGNKAYIREEALLAKTMGYTTHSNLLASKLSQQDAAYWYIKNDISNLRKAAQESKASEEILLYTLLSMAKTGRADPALFSLIKSRFDDEHAVFPALKAVTMQHKFETQRELPTLLRYKMYQPLPANTASKAKAESKASNIISLIVASALGANKLISTTVADFIKSLSSSFYYNTDQFVQHVNNIATSNAVGFVTPEYYSAFFTAPFYSSFYIEANFYIHSLASWPSLRALSHNLSQSNDSFSLAFADLLNTINDINSNFSSDSPRLRDMFANLPQVVGRRSMEILYEKTTNFYKSEDFEIYDIAADLAKRLDNRPDTRGRFAWIMFDRVHDLKMTERYLRGELAVAKEDNLATELLIATMSGDTPNIKSLLLSPNLSSTDRYYILGILAESDLPKKEISELLAAAAQTYPQDWEIMDNYLEFLMEQKDYPAVIKAAQEWISQNQSERGFPFIFAKLAISTAYYNMRDYEDALKALRPVVKSGQAGVLGRMALILDRLGQPQEAEKTFKIAKERYPDSEHITQQQMGFFWRNNRYAEAAANFDLLTKISYTKQMLKEAADLFVQAIGNNEQNALNAFAELDKMQIHPEKQSSFVNAIREYNPALAFAIRQSILGKIQGPNKVFILVETYVDLVKSQGGKYALAWMKYNVPPSLLNKMAVPIYEKFIRDNQDYSLLWTLIENPDPKDAPEYVWLTRTAASAGTGFRDGKKDILLQHYQTVSNSSNDYDHIARYILGLDKLETLYPIAETSPQRLGEVAYFIAVKAISEGNYNDAHDWLMLALSSAYKSDRELIWAVDILVNWKLRGKFLGYGYKTGE